MRSWKTKKSAQYWVDANERYKRAGDNQPSENYLLKNYNFNSVLEIGSGTGRLINLLKGYRGALDINSYLLKSVVSEVIKYNYDISKPIPLNLKYELVFTFQVLQHLNHKQFLKALDNIKRFATKEIWLMEGVNLGYADGDLTHPTGSYFHNYAKYLHCYRIDELHGGKILVFRSKV